MSVGRRMLRASISFCFLLLAGVFFVSADGAQAGTITVTSNVDVDARDTVISFREALLLSNGTLAFATLDATEQASVSGTVGSGTADTINFSIATVSKVITVTASSPLPSITDGSTTIDGYTQSGTTANSNATGSLNTVLVVELNGTNASTGSLITFASSDNIVRGLVIRNARNFGITSSGTCNNNVVQGNFIGMNLAGTTAAANLSGGINISGCSGWIVGTNGDGSNDASERNLISGNSSNGVLITSSSSSNVVAGNIIGLAIDGSTDRGNSTSGVRITVTSNTNRIGTNGDGVSDDIERNVISGNNTIGVYLNNSDSNTIAGNYIGTNAAGSSCTSITSGGSGVRIETGADNNIIGTDGSNDANNTSERNVISCNSEHGVAVDVSGPNANVIAGNYIGVDAGGTLDRGNTAAGIATAGGVTNLRIGTDGNGVADSEEGNVISGNNGSGIQMDVSSNNPIIAGNIIGLNATATGAVGNTNHGINIASLSGLRIGTNADGTSDATERNIISGNGQRGINLANLTGAAIIAGNYVGLDSTGAVGLGNAQQGIVFTNVDSSRIGTNGDGSNDTTERNIVSGNGGSGIIFDSGSDNNTIAGNYIGTDVAGSAAIGNGGFGGIELINSSSNNVVGTDGSNDAFNTNERNVISGNLIGVVSFSSANDNVVAGNYIGINAAGTAALPNTGSGIEMHDTITGVRIGTDADGIADTEERNIISGNGGHGVIFYSTVSGDIKGNYIGLNPGGSAVIANTNMGVYLESVDAVVIGTEGDGTGDSVEGNVISGNVEHGVFVLDSTDINIAGNIIGLDATGSVDLGNGVCGIFAEDSSDLLVGTDGDGISDTLERNVISGNDAGPGDLGGINFSTVDAAIVAGNYIGLNAAGTAAIGNTKDGITAYGASNNNVYGTNGDGVGDAAEGNVISGNNRYGILIDDSSSNTVAGNIIGLDPTGTNVFANTAAGIALAADTASSNDNIIGTNGDGVSDALERNIVSGNTAAGMQFNAEFTSSGNVIAGNYIGTDVTGLLPLGNGLGGDTGISLYRNFIGTVIGYDGTGDPAAERNVIVDSGWAGIYLWNDAELSNNTVIASNYIGVGADGITPMGNYVGIFVDSYVNDLTIGGDTLAEGNIIAHSTGDGGIVIINDPSTPESDGNRFSHNSIFDNLDIAIDITSDIVDYEADGITPNDAGDGDAGANEGMNFPFLSSVTADGVNITINGTLDTPNASTATVEVYLTNGFVHASGHGDLLTFLGTATPVNDSPGNWSLVVPNSELNPNISAIAIDAAGNTSEASCTWPPSVPYAVTDLVGTGLDGHVSLTWTEPNDGCDPITDYIVEYGLTAGFPGNAGVFSDGISSVTSADVTGLTNNQSYSFRIFAVNNLGTGASSNIAVATPTGIPDPIDDLMATSSDTQLVLSWTAPAGTISDYEVECGTTAGFPGTAATFDDGVSVVTTAIVTGLTNETSYSCRVYAVNGVGSSPESNTVVETPNTAEWVLDTANPAPYPIVGTAIVAPIDGTIEFYGPGATDSKGVTIYDPSQPDGSRWTSATIFPVDLNWPRAYIASDGFAYLVGHEFSSSNLTSFKITLGGGPAVQQTTSPIHRDELGAAFYDDSIYIFGGADGGIVRDDVFKYDALTDTWTTGLAPLPGTVRRQSAAETIDGLIYVAGGDTTEGGGGGSASLLTRLDIYDPLADSWSSGAAMPAKRAESCTTVYDGKMFVISGKGDAAVRQEVLRYDPVYDEWSKAASVTKQRKRCGATTVGTTMYAFGGHPQGTGFSVLYDDFDTMNVSNGAPQIATNLFVDDTDAQTGSNHPTGVTSGTPVFSAICNDPNWSDRLNMYRIQVDDNNDFSSLVWDSGAAGTSMPDCRQGVRSADITFGGAPLAQDGTTYYWRIKFWDDAGVEGPFSEPTTATYSFTMFDVNDAPSAPTNLFTNNSTAQFGSANPIGITSGTPVFSAICNDPDTGDIMDQYRIQVDDNNDFSSVVWDSGAAGTSMSDCVAGDRSQNLTFGGTPLVQDGATYYWRIKFWDDEPAEGAFSETVSTNTFTMATAGSGGGGTSNQVLIQQPASLGVPTIGEARVLGSDSVSFSFTYVGSNQIGFRLLDGLNEPIVELPNGYATMITETGLPHNSLVSGRKVAAYNNATQGIASATYPDVYTLTIPVTPALVSRNASAIHVRANEVLNNMVAGQSGVQFELMDSEGLVASAVVQSPWLQVNDYVFADTVSGQAYNVRARARNFDGIETPWSNNLLVPGEEVVSDVEFLVGLSVRRPSGSLVTGDAPLNPNELMQVDMTILNNGSTEAENVFLALPLPPYVQYVPSTLSIDGRMQTDRADLDAGQAANDVVGAIWPSLDFAFGHTVRFQLAFDTQRLIADFIEPVAGDVKEVMREIDQQTQPLTAPQVVRDEFVKPSFEEQMLLQPTEALRQILAQAIAADGPQLVLQASATHSGEPQPAYSNPVTVQPDLVVLADHVAPPEPEPVDEEEPAPTPVPTPEETHIIQEIFQEEFGTNPTPSTTLETGETVSSHDDSSFSLSVGNLTLTGFAVVTDGRIEFTGTSSEPFTVITLIFNDGITAIAVSDENGEWRTFVDAEALGLRSGESSDIHIEAIAAKGALRSERVAVGDVTLSRGLAGEVTADFETVVSDNAFVTAINEISRQTIEVIQEQEPAIQTTLTAAVPVVVVSSVPLWGYLPYLPTLIHHFIAWIFALFGRKKKDEEKKTYGVIYDAISKLPLPLAIVRVYERTVNKLVTTVVTDKLGRYDVLLAPGTYRLEVSKPEYTFPSQIVTTTIDGAYDRVYHAKEGMSVQENVLVIPHVPVDPINVQRDWEMAIGFRKAWLAVQRVGHYLATPILIVGTLSGVLLVVADPSKPFNWVIVALYVVLLLSQLRLKPKAIRAWGVVYDIATNAVLPLTAIQLIEPAYNKVVTSRLTDYQGRFSFLPEPGQYVVKANKPGYEQVKEVIESKYTDRKPMSEQVSVDKPDQRIAGDVAMRSLN